MIRRHADLIVQDVTDSKVNGMTRRLNDVVFGPGAPEQTYEQLIKVAAGMLASDRSQPRARLDD